MSLDMSRWYKFYVVMVILAFTANEVDKHAKTVHACERAYRLLETADNVIIDFNTNNVDSKLVKDAYQEYYINTGNTTFQKGFLKMFFRKTANVTKESGLTNFVDKICSHPALSDTTKNISCPKLPAPHYLHWFSEFAYDKLLLHFDWDGYADEYAYFITRYISEHIDI
jgi:hypothetical protein